MIEVQYDGKALVTARGHAGAGEKGQDLVCAAVTALLMTLGENSRKQDLRPGNARISGGDPNIYRAICRGFARMAVLFPKYVHYTYLGYGENKK